MQSFEMIKVKNTFKTVGIIKEYSANSSNNEIFLWSIIKLSVFYTSFVQSQC